MANLSRKKLDEMLGIYESQFPSAERRKISDQKKIMKDDRYEIDYIDQDGLMAAFCATWNLEGFIFIEHLAVRETHKGYGYGTLLLERQVKQGRPLILEVELPEDEIRKKRIAFYEKIGFHLNKYEYSQPPLSEGGSNVEMMVMSHPGSLSEDEFKEIRQTLYSQVYGI